MNTSAMQNNNDATMVLDDSQFVHAPSKYRWVIRFGLVLAFALLVAWFMDWLFHPQRFPIEEIEIQGELNKVSGEQVTEVVSATLKGNFFSLNLKQLEQSVKDIPEVFSSSIRRRWPSTIVVDIVEVKPVARWGQSKWVNFTGHLMPMPSEPDDDYAEDLPMLQGPDGDSPIVWDMFQRWSSRFASTGLNLNKLGLDNTGLWTFELSLSDLVINQSQGQSQEQSQSQLNTAIMIVDQQHTEDKINRFIEVLNQELIIRFPNMRSIDLRYPNGFAIMWRDMEAGQMWSDASSVDEFHSQLTGQ